MESKSTQEPSGQTTEQDVHLESVEDLDLVIDADAHVTEHWEDVLSYMDDRHSGIKEILVEAKHPLHDVFSKIHPTPSHPFREHAGDDMYSIGLNNAKAKIDEMDEHGIDGGLITSSLCLGVPTVNNSRFAVAIANAYNSWLKDNMHGRSDRIRTAVSIAPQKPSKAAEEIDRMAGEKEIVGVQLPSTGLLPPPGHEMYDPIYQAAEDNGLSIIMHGSGVNGFFSFPTQMRWTETDAESHAWLHPFSHFWNLTTMLFRGVPERFPELDFVFQEAGVAWVPYWKWRLDDHYLERSYDIPWLEKLPSEYIDDQFYFTTQPLGLTANNPEHLARAIEMAGPQNVLWASDLPHPDFDTPDELFDRINGYFDPDVVRAMMGETAAELFEFET